MRAECSSPVACVKVSTAGKVAPQVSIRRLSGMTGGEANFLRSLTLEGRAMPSFLASNSPHWGEWCFSISSYSGFRFKADLTAIIKRPRRLHADSLAIMSMLLRIGIGLTIKRLVFDIR